MYRLRDKDGRLALQAGGIEAREQISGGWPPPDLVQSERGGHPREDLFGPLAQSAAVGERHRAMAFCQAPPVGSEHEGNVSVAGRGQAE